MGTKHMTILLIVTIEQLYEQKMTTLRARATRAGAQSEHASNGMPTSRPLLVFSL